MQLLDRIDGRPRGWVRAEIYDPETREIIKTVENHNIVTNSAAQILAGVLANPYGSTAIRVTEMLDADSVADRTGYFPLQLSYHRSEQVVKTLSGTGDDRVLLGTTRRLTKLYSIRVDGAPLEIDREVWISDEDAGEITFETAPAAGSSIEAVFAVEANSRVRMAPGSEVVKVGTVTYHRSTATDASGNLIPEPEGYVIDPELGIIWFDTPVEGVEIEYTYKAALGLAYMGISDRPENHEVGRPVVFTDAHRHYTRLDAEFPNSRQPLIFPADITIGSTFTEQVIGNGYDTVFTLSHRDLLAITEAYNISKGQVLAVGTDVMIEDSANGRVRFANPPALTDVIRLVYTWDSGSTVSFVADFPAGVPGPRFIEGATYSTVTTDSDGNGVGDRSYTLPETPVAVTSVTVGGTPLSSQQYSLNGNVLTLSSSPAIGVPLKVVYNYNQTRADIYEVGLFDALEEGLMFAISGIGPISKDASTGMRITWSITF